MKFRKKSHYGLSLLALGAAIAAPQFATPAQAALFGLSEQEEIEAGKEVAAQAQKEYGAALPYNDPMSVRVRAIGQQFANLSTRKNIPYTYTVLANDKVLNAFAAPGGPIFVTRKLVTTTSNDAELAYVLGHETGHIERKHIVKSVEKQQKAGILVGVLGAILGKGKGGNAIGALGSVAFNVWQNGYGRDQEKEADVVGVRFMSQLGYDPHAAITMLGKLDDGSKAGFLDKYLATHPEPKQRQAIVSNVIKDENLDDVARRMGGPKLWMSGSNNWGAYNAGYDPNYNPTYSQTYNPNNPNSPDYYPPVDSSHNPVYDAQPNYDGTTTSNQYPPNYSTGGSIDFGAPLTYAERNNKRYYLAPVLEVARWAGATANQTRDIIKVTRGNYVLSLRENSTAVDYSGRRTALSVPTQRYNGTLYAPIGALIQGIGGTASYDSNTQRINITVGDRSGYVQLQ